MAGAETFSNGFLIIQAGVVLLTVLALVGSMMFAKRAVKASSSIREAQKEAQALYGSMDREMQNMQMMSDEMRRMADELAQRQDDLSARLQGAVVPASLAGDASAASEDAPARKDFSEESEDLKKPSALFRGLLRRR